MLNRLGSATRLIGMVMLSLGIAFGPAPAFARKAPLVLEPSSKWVLSYDADGCTLGRTFGEGDKRTNLLIRRFEPSNYFSMTVYGKPMHARNPDKPAKLRFGATEEELELEFFAGKVDKNIPALIFHQRMTGIANMDGMSFAEVFERQLAMETLTIGRPIRQDVTLKMGSLAMPMRGMRQCINDLMEGWGLNANTQRNLSKRPIPETNPGKWGIKFPRDMLALGQPAVVNFRLMIDDKGTVESCHIQSTTRPKQFDDAVCLSIMKKASFEPALDVLNRPVPSYYQSKVIFRF